MSKITKKQLQKSVDLLNKENSSQHDYLMRIKRALKSIDIDILSDEFYETKPQLKQLDKSVFDGLDEKWRFAAVDQNAETNLFEEKPVISNCGNYWVNASGAFKRSVLHFDNSNWQNSLIERDIAKELTGSEDTNILSDIISDIVDELLDSEYFYSKITCELLRIGCSYVLAYVSDVSEQDAIKSKEVAVIDSVDVMLNDTDGNDWKYAVPINNQGEPLTASEVGL